MIHVRCCRCVAHVVSHTQPFMYLSGVCVSKHYKLFSFFFFLFYFFMQEDLVKETKKVYIYDLPAMLSVVFLYIYHSIRKFIV